ncbi:MAG: cobalamin-dependent protein [Methanobrevibacter sp.]|nr:cobalamin-dependent protein [Methanobrevibacter sp.]
MKILFLNLPYEFNISRASRWPEKTKSGTLYYPYWLAYCVGVCEREGFECKLVDCITKAYSIEDTIEEVKEYEPDYIMAEITTPTCAYDYKVINSIKEAYPKAKIMIGGTHATILPDAVLNECLGIDYILRQEYDYTVGELINSDDVSNVKGVSYRVNCDGEDIAALEDVNILTDSIDFNINHTEDREPLEDLDSLPYVSKVYEKYLNFDDYAYAFAQKPMIQIVSSRGCPNQCNFCSYPSTMGGRIYRTRSVSDLADEFEYILNELPEIKEIFIEDDTFTVNQPRVIEFCDEIIKEFTQEGDTVLDCFNGLGTTMLSCKEFGCKYIGIELSEKYCQKTIERYLDYDMGDRNVKVLRNDSVYTYDDIKDYIQKPQMSIFDFI